MLSKEQILAAMDLPKQEIKIPEWGGSVYIRTMTGRDRDRFEAEHIKDPYKDIRARLAVYCMCDEAGNLLFTQQDVDAVASKSAGALDRIFSAALKLNGISSRDVDELKNA